MEKTADTRPLTEAPPTTTNGASPASPGRRRVNRGLIVPLAVVVGVLVLGFAYRTYYNATHYVWTDNAQISGAIVPVGALNAGEVTAVLTDVGQHVNRGQVLARVAVPQTLATTASGQAKQGYTASANQLVDVTAPLSGVVVAKLADVGATVAPGQGIVALVDPTQLYVTANVNETDVARIQPGQTVDVTVDSLSLTLPGRIDAVTPASAASFSLIPQSNASGNFTKVVQVVPVKISVNYGSAPLIVGSSVEVNIHVQ